MSDRRKGQIANAMGFVFTSNRSWEWDWLDNERHNLIEIRRLKPFRISEFTITAFKRVYRNQKNVYEVYIHPKLSKDKLIHYSYPDHGWHPRRYRANNLEEVKKLIKKNIATMKRYKIRELGSCTPYPQNR